MRKAPSSSSRMLLSEVAVPLKGTCGGRLHCLALDHHDGAGLSGHAGAALLRELADVRADRLRWAVPSRAAAPSSTRPWCGPGGDAGRRRRC